MFFFLGHSFYAARSLFEYLRNCKRWMLYFVYKFLPELIKIRLYSYVLVFIRSVQHLVEKIIRDELELTKWFSVRVTNLKEKWKENETKKKKTHKQTKQRTKQKQQQQKRKKHTSLVILKANETLSSFYRHSVRQQVLEKKNLCNQIPLTSIIFRRIFKNSNSVRHLKAVGAIHLFTATSRMRQKLSF